MSEQVLRRCKTCLKGFAAMATFLAGMLADLDQGRGALCSELAAALRLRDGLAQDVEAKVIVLSPRFSGLMLRSVCGENLPQAPIAAAVKRAIMAVLADGYPS